MSDGHLPTRALQERFRQIDEARREKDRPIQEEQERRYRCQDAVNAFANALYPVLEHASTERHHRRPFDPSPHIPGIAARLGEAIEALRATGRLALLDGLDLDGACQQGVGGGFGPREKVRLALDCAAQVLREPPVDRAALESLVRELWFDPALYPAGPALHLLLRILSGMNRFDRKRPATGAEGGMTAEPLPTGSIRSPGPDDPHARIHTALRCCVAKLETLWLLARPGLPPGPVGSEEQAREVIDGGPGAGDIDLRTRLDFLAAAEAADEWRQLDAWRFLWAVADRVRPHFDAKIPWPTTWGRVRAELLKWQPPPEFDHFHREADANLKRIRGLETPPPSPAAAPLGRVAGQAGSQPSLDPATEAIMARARTAEAHAIEVRRAHAAAESRLRRARHAWERVRSFKGDRIPANLTGNDWLMADARLVVELGRVLMGDGWQSRVDAVPAGNDAKTFALTILRRAMDGDVDGVAGLLGEAVSTMVSLGLEADRWLREGLMYEVLDIRPAPEPPAHWEGVYLESPAPAAEKAPPPSDLEANFLIRRYLKEHPTDYSIRKASKATGISTGRISGLSAWIARPPRTATEATNTRSNRRERQLTEAILVNVGVEADPSDQASLREAAWSYAEKNAQDEKERRRLRDMTPAEREQVIASVIDHFDKQVPE
jgi:hypothetical protein